MGFIYHFYCSFAIRYSFAFPDYDISHRAKSVNTHTSIASHVKPFFLSSSSIYCHECLGFYLPFFSSFGVFFKVRYGHFRLYDSHFSLQIFSHMLISICDIEISIFLFSLCVWRNPRFTIQLLHPIFLFVQNLDNRVWNGKMVLFLFLLVGGNLVIVAAFCSLTTSLFFDPKTHDLSFFVLRSSCLLHFFFWDFTIEQDPVSGFPFL